MSTREDFAAALTTVAGVTGYASAPKVVRPGDAWASLSALDRGPGMTWSRSWSVLVVLGTSDPVQAEADLDALLDPLLAAISRVAYVESAEPVQLPTDMGGLFALKITTTRE